VIAPIVRRFGSDASEDAAEGPSAGGIRDWRVATGASAILAARRAIHEGVETPNVWIAFARGLQAAAQERAAWEIVSRQLPVLLDGAEPRVLQAAADVALSAGKLKEFLQLREKAAADADDSERRAALVSTYRTLAEAYNLRGDERTSLAFLQRAYELSPEDLDTRLLLADALWASGDRLGACEHYRALLVLAPAHAERRRIFGRLQEFVEADRPVVAGAR
jgi:tetratricopeptide (TPR) repeat protein